jgi:uncharacterized tellurite resistance protein B-like protein
MQHINLNKILLKTAFSCMACDGDIDKSELVLIMTMHQKNKIFGDIEIDYELDHLIQAINQDGQKFINNYFNELISSELSEQDELKIIEVAIKTIKADDKIQYSEIKFFKVIRSKLKIDNAQILALHPDFEEYLEQDIMSKSYLSGLQEPFFDVQALPQLSIINTISNDYSDLINTEE